MILSEEQKTDLERRLSSFKTHGLLPAASACDLFTEEGASVITSSERGLNPALCFNLVNISKKSRKDPGEILRNIMCHDTHGFINMAIERHYFTECSERNEFKAQVAARLFCSFVFLFNPTPIIAEPRTIERRNPIAEDLCELMTTKGVSFSDCYAVLVPNGLEEIVRTIYPDLPIYSAPMRLSHLSLSLFTLSTAIMMTEGSQVLPEVDVPDYGFALKQFISDHPEINQFATHLSRFSTLECFNNPFRPFLVEEQSRIQGEAMMRLGQLASRGHPMETTCVFAPTTGIGRIASLSLFNPPLDPSLPREVKAQILSL